MAPNNPEKCPYCGKVLVNSEKLAWHLTHECPELVNLAAKSRKKGKK